MGACLSCLGLDGHPNSTGDQDVHGEPTETSRLVHRDNDRAEYGATNAGDLMRIQDIEDDDPQEQQVAAWLQQTWRETSDKLIDISSLPDPSAAPEALEDNSDSEHPSRSSQDYEKFFNDTFKTARRPTSSSGRPAIHRDTFVPPSGTSSEQDWLRSIILRDPKGDCNRVVKIGKPLIISFDEIVASDENEQQAVVPMNPL